MSFRNSKGQFIKGMKNGFESFLALGRQWKKDHALTDSEKKTRGWYYVGKLKYYWKNCGCCGNEYQGQGAEFCSYTCSRLVTEAIKSNRHIKTLDDLDRNYYKRIRNCVPYRNWRIAIYKRDNYECVLCGDTEGQLEVDHYPKSFIKILNENKIKRLDDALLIDELWDINNGRTLCNNCHKETDTYGGNLK